tara:strand:+ start:66 stop:224 length:159 start_codon:yes stop_codon:yes gene_type:complete
MTRELNDSELEADGKHDESMFDTNHIKSEITSWLEGLDYKIVALSVEEEGKK